MIAATLYALCISFNGVAWTQVEYYPADTSASSLAQCKTDVTALRATKAAGQSITICGVTYPPTIRLSCKVFKPK